MSIIYSILSFVANIFTRTTRPAADSTANTTFAEVIGNKSDATVFAVNSTASTHSLIKGLINAQLLRKVGHAARGITSQCHNSGDSTVLSLSGSGVLTEISQLVINWETIPVESYLTVTIDGTTICGLCILIRTMPGGTGMNSLAFNHPFYSSLVVTHSHSGTNNQDSIETNVTYTQAT